MLNEIRNEIDIIDDQIADLFNRRMALVTKAAEYKQKNNIPTLDKTRECDIIKRVTAANPDEFTEYTEKLFNTIFELSRGYQNNR
ncbi:MAG: chorismate mutase [Oscillospiraceae bacterium]|nr:chorismate mutase [Oscillospiraceae bacterium]